VSKAAALAYSLTSSWSPPKALRYHLRPTPARRNNIKMDGGRAKWDEETTKTFLDLCIAEKEKRNYNNRGLTRFGWQNVYRNFRQLTGRAYDTKQMQNKFNTLKRVYKAWKNLKDKSGGGWNNKKNTISLDPELWDTEIMVNSEADQFKDKALHSRMSWPSFLDP
ncbi:hypothetical protein U9M48_000344, partial [Paspalum notatum var. saurae]